MRKLLWILGLFLVQASFGQQIDAKAKLINQFIVLPDGGLELISATSSDNHYVFNLTEKKGFENPAAVSEPFIIREFQKLENGNYQLRIENRDGKNDIQLLIDIHEKKLIFQLEVDAGTQLKIEYLLDELILQE